MYAIEAQPMTIKFSEDVIPLSDLKVNPGKIVNRAKDTHRPILITSRGRGIAVVQGLSDYEESQEERYFIKAVTQGLIDIKEGNEVGLDELKNRLGIDWVEIFISDSAVNDLEGINQYYEEEGVPGIGSQFVASIINHVHTLQDNPDIGRIVP